jgi:hypothetical protein
MGPIHGWRRGGPRPAWTADLRGVDGFRGTRAAGAPRPAAGPMMLVSAHPPPTRSRPWQRTARPPLTGHVPPSVPEPVEDPPPVGSVPAVLSPSVSVMSTAQRVSSEYGPLHTAPYFGHSRLFASVYASFSGS